MSHFTSDNFQSLDFLKMLEGDQIRILDLLPSTNHDEIMQGETHVVSLADKPQYETLSYRWGDPNNTKNILISGQAVAITVTLHAALCRLRLPDKKRRVWIDQVCIKQDDIEEKISQVRLMGKIYESCSQCTIWFGEIAEHIELKHAEAAVELIKYLANEAVEPVALQSDDDFFGAMNATETISVWSQPWWQRVWTLQEAVLPSRKVILWGPLTLMWEHLDQYRGGWFTEEYCDRAWYYHEKGYKRDHLYELLLHVMWVNDTFDTNLFGMLRLIIIWREKRDAADPRDKVFGYSGISKQNTMPLVQACNYETPLAALYGAATLDIIRNDGLQALMMNPRLEEGRRTQDVPSWAIDLNGHVRYHTDNWYSFWGYGCYNACAGRDFDTEWLQEMVAESQGR